MQFGEPLVEADAPLLVYGGFPCDPLCLEQRIFNVVETRCRSILLCYFILSALVLICLYNLSYHCTVFVFILKS